MSGARNTPSNNGGKKQLNKNQMFRRQKVRNARTIRTEAILTSSKKKNGETPVLSEDGGMIMVDQFVSSREFELKQLQYAMLKSKTSSATRVFQALPRKLRRRTASHNVKRIPKRMRNRALREMQKNDQQSTINKLAAGNRKAHGLTAARLYRARMSVKLLRLVSRSMSMKLALPKDITASRFNVRQKIKVLKKLIKNSKHTKQKMSADVNTGRLNNKCGSYDNTGINKLAPLPRGRIKYCKRQRQFSWLPTHIWNAKRSHLIKRWGYNIPWSPSQKCFKLTHRLGSGVAASDGALCMDTSFMGTMIIRSIANSNTTLKEVVSKLTNGRASLKKYMVSKNLYEGLLYNLEEDGSKSTEILGPCNLLWLNENEVMLRLHPSLYSSIFYKLVNTFSASLEIHDCRYSLSSMTIRGAKALTALSSVLRSTKPSKSFEQFKNICQLSDTKVLPSKVLLAMEIVDPRHLATPKRIENVSPIDVEDIISLSQDGSLDKEFTNVVDKLITSEGRKKSYNNQQTLKQLAIRCRQHEDSNKINEPQTPKRMIPYNVSSDPSIPLLLMKRSKQNDWLVVLPWFWHLPLWYQLNRISRVYNIGLRQVQQLSYENKQLYFPDDYPFTQIGAMENSTYKNTALKAKWEKKTTGKRLNFDKIQSLHLNELPAINGEIGDYFSCDWKFLQIMQNGLEYLRQNNTNDDGSVPMINEEKTTQYNYENNTRALSCFNDVLELYNDITDNSLGESIESQLPSTPICLVNKKQIKKIEIPQFQSTVDVTKKPLPVTAISCKLVRRGHPKDNARIYEIPTQDIKYWKNIKEGTYRADGRLDNDSEIPLPDIYNLIGYITSGTYNLADGCGRGNGFIQATHLDGDVESFTKSYVLIRNVGSNVYRLAKIEAIHV